MTEKLRQTLAAYHVIGALAGLAVLRPALAASAARPASWLLIIAGAGLFGTMGAAGVMLAKQHPRGPLLASVVQCALLPAAATPWLEYSAYSPLGLTVSVDFASGAVNLTGALGADLHWLGRHAGNSAVVGVNVAALCALILVQRGTAGPKPVPTSGGLVTR